MTTSSTARIEFTVESLLREIARAAEARRLDDLRTLVPSVATTASEAALLTEWIEDRRSMIAERQTLEPSVLRLTRTGAPLPPLPESLVRVYLVRIRRSTAEAVSLLLRRLERTYGDDPGWPMLRDAGRERLAALARAGAGPASPARSDAA